MKKINNLDAGVNFPLIDIVPISSMGQGIAWDRTEPGIIYGITKKNRQVVVSTIKLQTTEH